MFKKKTTSKDVADTCRNLAAEATDPAVRDEYEFAARLADRGLVPPHIKGSVFSRKGRH